MDFWEYDTRVAAYAVVLEDDRMLVTWWNGEGLHAPAWTLPGGGVEFDESLEAAVHREVKEETGLDIELGPVLGTHSWSRGPAAPNHRHLKAVRILYSARVVGGTLGTLEVGGSTDFAAWMPLAELAAAESRVSLIDEALALVRRLDLG